MTTTISLGCIYISLVVYLSSRLPYTIQQHLMATLEEGNKWRARIAAHNKHGAHKDILADTSEENLDFIWSKWATFCAEAGFDPEATLSDPDAATIKTFFEYKNQRGTAQIGSNHTYFRRLKQHVVRISGQALNPTICKDVNAYIRHHLEGQKETAPRERPVASAQDFIAMLRFLYLQDTTKYPDERQRVQQAFLMQIMAYSALRPSSTTAARKRKRGGVGVLQKSARLKKNVSDCTQVRDNDMPTEDDKADVAGNEEARLVDAEVRVKYGDFRLFLILDESNQVRLGIEPQYKHYKGERRRKQLKTFTYWTLPYVLACPAATLLALALHDGALQDVKTLDDLLKLRIPSGMDQIELYWSDEWYQRCIMRESGQEEPDKELSSAKARYRFARLGENMGLQQRFVAYCLRRFCLNLLSTKAGSQVRRQVAGHTNDQIYEDHYIDQHIGIDVANIVLDNPTEDKLTSKLHRMTAGADPSINAPLPQAISDYIEQMPDLAALLAKRRDIKDAIGACLCEDTLSDLRQQRKECTDRIRARKQYYAKEYRLGHFKRRNQHIVRAQLDGQGCNDVMDLSHPSSLHQKKTSLAERLYLGQLEAKFPAWSPVVADTWSQGLRALQDLCGRIERKTERRDEITGGSEEESKDESRSSASGSAGVNADNSDLFPYNCDPAQCIFCLGDRRLHYKQRTRPWKPTHVLWRHVATQHLKKLKSSEKISCPHPTCQTHGTVLNNKAHFLSHAQIEHGVRLQKAC